MVKVDFIMFMFKYIYVNIFCQTNYNAGSPTWLKLFELPSMTPEYFDKE